MGGRALYLDFTLAGFESKLTMILFFFYEFIYTFGGWAGSCDPGGCSSAVSLIIGYLSTHL